VNARANAPEIISGSLNTTEEATQGLLKTDVALIGANETHAVLAVRISRKALADNHFFLNVLSDLAGDAGG
jgi:hypothetical protein